MAEITRERTGEVLRKLFGILIAEPEGLQASEALKRLAQGVTLTAYEAGNYASGDRRFEKIVRFATLATVKAGWLLKQKGRWTVTDEGKSAYQKYADGGAFYRRASELYQQWRKSLPDEDPEDKNKSDGAEAEKTVAITFEEAEEKAWAEIQDYLRGMPPYEFQELVASLLRAMGYHVSWIAPPGRDGGVDILAASDPLGTRPPRIKVQVKRQAANIPVESLRAFMSQLSDDDVGLFVTTSSFTRDAQEEARYQERRRVTLIDLERLVELWTEHYDRIEQGAKQRLPLKPIYFLAPQV
jgi:restriction system protein